MRNLHYILNEHGEPVPEPDLLKWARWLESADRSLSFTLIEHDGTRYARVSTVFLGLDHNHTGHGAPILWESMIFSQHKSIAYDMLRARSAALALENHGELVARVLASLPGATASPADSPPTPSFPRGSESRARRRRGPR